ncbi:MAG: serine/threonine-protein kinase [Rhodoferax sp.]
MADINKLGRYDILRVLGKGAMGVVYVGVDPNLERQVAIKTIRMQTLSPEAATEFEGRFRTEARSAARLHHPNIVSVFDSGHDGDTTFLVMELIDGLDLKRHLEAGARFSVRTAVLMVHDLLLALEHAHQQKVVHRDVKPANILIERNGRVKLTDFGVARIQEPEESGLTQVGGSVGTPRYMAPEQAKGLRGDSRSDLFSAAVVLYELLTGEPPFQGENAFVIIHQINSHEPPPPSSLNPAVPMALDAVMQKALAKDPAQRYATAREFAHALRTVVKAMPAEGGDTHARTRLHGEDDSFQDGSSTGIFGPGDELAQILDQPTVPEPGVPTQPRQTWPLWAAAGAALVLAAGGIWWGLRTPRPAADAAVAAASAPAVLAPASATAPRDWPQEEIIESSRPATSAAAARTAPSTPAPTPSAASPQAMVVAVAGPSAPGEACAERGFFFRCVRHDALTRR